MKNLYELLESFLLVYLPKERGYSKNTILSYYEGIKQMLGYIQETTTKTQSQITIYDFSRENINNYLLNIEKKGKSIATRNQRLAAISSFIGYCAMIEPIYQNTYTEITTIKMKKDAKNKRDFLTIDEYQDFISQINLKEWNGLRYYTLINVLYDTACRVQELIDIKVEDLNYGSNYSIKIMGKGNKQRIVYISGHTAELIQEYCKKYHITNGFQIL
jgi:site-specific recombinase XerD